MNVSKVAARLTTDISRLAVYTAALRLFGPGREVQRLSTDPYEHTGMTRFLEFFVDHWILSGLWLVLFTALIAYINSKLGKSLSLHQATLLVNKDDGVFLDVRERKDFERGHIVDSINIPLAKLHERITELDKKKELPIIVVCQVGHQSSEAVKALQAKGFTNVSKMAGGITEWQVQNLPLVK